MIGQRIAANTSGSISNAQFDSNERRATMKTKASFAGGPIHPMLAHYPIALWTTSVITDAIFYFNRNSSLVLISKYLIAAGIVGALLAALPGIVDWTGIGDPVAKKTGTLHLVLSVSALL